jgi:hypothetical protein
MERTGTHWKSRYIKKVGSHEVGDFHKCMSGHETIFTGCPKTNLIHCALCKNGFWFNVQFDEYRENIFIKYPPL